MEEGVEGKKREARETGERKGTGKEENSLLNGGQIKTKYNSLI